MKRKIYSVILSAVIACGILLSGCDGLSGCYVKISSLDDLYAMASNKSYELTCDLDLNGGEWYPLAVKNFNGNGYTIKNGYIIETTENQSSGFFTSVNTLENVVFDNIQVNVTFSDDSQGTYNGGIIAGEAKTVDCVTITGSKGFFTASVDNSSSANSVNCGVIAGYVGGKISNSRVENCELKCTRIYSKLNVGCIAGEVFSNQSEKVTDNVAENSKIYADADTLNCGGIIGCLNQGSGKTSGCVSKNNVIELKVYPEYTASRYDSCAGGVIGRAAEKNVVENCVGGNNVITLSRKSRNQTLFTDEGGYRVGGIIGKSAGNVSDCLSEYNDISCKSESTSTKQFARIGGLCGSATATISRSVSLRNTVAETNTAGASSMFSAGFVAKTTATVTDCAVYNNTINGKNRDVFTDKAKDSLFNCYVACQNEAVPDANSLPVLSSEQWNDIINVLSLGSKWYMENGVLNLR